MGIFLPLPSLPLIKNWGVWISASKCKCVISQCLCPFGGSGLKPSLLLCLVTLLFATPCVSMPNLKIRKQHSCDLVAFHSACPLYFFELLFSILSCSYIVPVQTRLSKQQVKRQSGVCPLQDILMWLLNHMPLSSSLRPAPFSLFGLRSTFCLCPFHTLFFVWRTPLCLL